MAYLLDISTAVPEFSVSNSDLIKFYSKSLQEAEKPLIEKKMLLFSERTRIENRYSCIPDFNGNDYELFIDGNYIQSVESRIDIYKKKIIPLAAKAISKLFLQTKIVPSDITHLITVSCTGISAPGFEFMIAEHYGMQHTEKLAINFLGCYAAVKAIKHADYIAEADPKACILIVCAELCSLHYSPSDSDEALIANLLFADGAAATIICGKESNHSKNKLILNIDAIGSACIPNTMNLMTWNISSSAFKMYLSKNIPIAIRNNIRSVVNNFPDGTEKNTDYWAVHPGGVRIVQSFIESLDLGEDHVEDSMNVLRNYGNMSSPTILFILNRILNKIKKLPVKKSKKIFSCAFGPGLSIEMIRFSSVDTSSAHEIKYTSPDYAVQV